MKLYAICAAAMVICGCASKSSDITPAFVSPVMYQDYDCNQLAQEAQVVSQKAAIATKRQDDNRKNDTVKTTVGVVLFWPVILMNEGNGQDAANLSMLKGQMEAIEAASRQKGCNLTFQRG